MLLNIIQQIYLHYVSKSLKWTPTFFCQDIFEPMLVLLKTCEIQDAKYTIAKLQFMLRYKFFAVIHIYDNF